jgi:hypothetical protein
MEDKMGKNNPASLTSWVEGIFLAMFNLERPKNLPRFTIKKMVNRCSRFYVQGSTLMILKE